MKSSFGQVVKWIRSALLFFISLNSFGQAVVTNAGDWDDTGIWSGGDIGDNLETVTFNNTIGTVVIPDATSYTIGGLTMGNSNTLSVNGFLSIGDISNTADLTANNGCTITIGSSGEVIIWGNLVAFNNLSFGLGKLTIKGNLDVKNGAQIDIVGTVQIDGNFIADNNTIVNIGPSGTLNVDGEYNVGTGSVMTGTGTATGDPCTGPADFCIFSPLPVELVEFYGIHSNNTIELFWITASELNNDYFEVQKSEDGVNFTTIGKVTGNGTVSKRNSYQFVDHMTFEKSIYYRLNQVDFDGTNEFSKLIVVSDLFEQVGEVRLYPNPIQSGNDSFVSSTLGLKKVIVLDINGRQLMSLHPNNENETVIKLPKFTNSGIYFISYELVNGSTGQVRFIQD